MRIVLVGGGGYIGRNLSAHLSRIGADVIDISSGNPGGIDPISGLFHEFPKIPAGVNAVVYLSQSPLYRDVPNSAFHVLAVNNLSAVMAAEAARVAGVKKFIYLSTGSVYAPSFAPLGEESPLRRDNWYSLSKIHAEESLNLYREYMDVTIVRPFGVYGPKQQGRLIPNLIESVAIGRQISLQPKVGYADKNHGLQISLCFIDDAIEILVKLILNSSPPCINLAGNEALTIFEMANEIGGRLGIAPEYISSNNNRESDLIANIDKLKEIHIHFTSFSKGLSEVISNYRVK